jgi:hypothetical protein
LNTSGGFTLTLFTGPEIPEIAPDLKAGDFLEVATQWLGGFDSPGERDTFRAVYSRHFSSGVSLSVAQGYGTCQMWD